MKTKIAILVIAAAILASFGTRMSDESKKTAHVASAEANSTVGGIAEDSK